MKPILKFSQLDTSKQYTYADYLTWQFKERVELIKGWIYKMSPAPKRIHQELSRRLEVSIDKYLKDKNCKIYHAPFDVRLIKNKGQKNREIQTVVQPDICVICDLNKLDKYGCLGAPDWIIEILLKSSMKTDEVEKFQLYEENKVREYWIVDVKNCIIKSYLFNNKTKKYELINYYSNDNENIPVSIFQDLKFDYTTLFKDL